MRIHVGEKPSPEQHSRNKSHVSAQEKSVLHLRRLKPGEVEFHPYSLHSLAFDSGLVVVILDLQALELEGSSLTLVYHGFMVHILDPRSNILRARHCRLVWIFVLVAQEAQTV